MTARVLAGIGVFILLPGLIGLAVDGPLTGLLAALAFPACAVLFAAIVALMRIVDWIFGVNGAGE